MTQQIIVYIIGVVVLAYIGTQVYRRISGKGPKHNQCDGCSGCDLKKEINCNKQNNSKK